MSSCLLVSAFQPRTCGRAALNWVLATFVFNWRITPMIRTPEAREWDRNTAEATWALGLFDANQPIFSRAFGVCLHVMK